MGAERWRRLLRRWFLDRVALDGSVTAPMDLISGLQTRRSCHWHEPRSCPHFLTGILVESVEMSSRNKSGEGDEYQNFNVE